MRHIPEAGAVCGNSARTDLRGGRGATSVPTATFVFLKPLRPRFAARPPTRVASYVCVTTPTWRWIVSRSEQASFDGDGVTN